jgi:F0F1-type ATP synthase assembly protein I
MQKNRPIPSSGGDSIRRGNTVALNAFSRVLAVLVFMILCGVSGALLDRWLGTSIFILIGFGLGMVFAIAGMVYVVKVAELESRQQPNSEATHKSEGKEDEPPESVG